MLSIWYRRALRVSCALPIILFMVTRFGSLAHEFRGNLFARDVTSRTSSEEPLTSNQGYHDLERLNGYLLLQQGRPKDAVNQLERVAYRDPMASFWLGEAYSRLDRHDDAIAAWRTAGTAPYFFQQGLASSLAMDYAAGLRSFLLATEIAPDFAEAHMWAGHCFRRLMDPERAEMEYLQAIEADPDFGYPYIHLATLYNEDRKDPGNARRILEECIAHVTEDFWQAACEQQLALLVGK